jgi:hypothetical protein
VLPEALMLEMFIEVLPLLVSVTGLAATCPRYKVLKLRLGGFTSAAPKFGSVPSIEWVSFR